jgi:hypothetical protein
VKTPAVGDQFEIEARPTIIAPEIIQNVSKPEADQLPTFEDVKR